MLAYEATIRLSVFLGLFVILAVAERLLPKRKRQGLGLTAGRWGTNWGILIVDSLALRLVAIVIPLLAVGAAIDAGNKGWGLFNNINLPLWLEFLAVLLIFDFCIWFQHLLTHKVPFLWRMHQVHHADTEMDVTTAVRFHPFEIALSMFYKVGLVYLFGPAAVAIMIYEVMLNGMALFNHSNMAIPQSVYRWLRLFVVTPDMHRVHHSVERREHDSNYGNTLALWDRLFGTYIPQPKAGHEEMPIGLRWQDKRPRNFLWTILMPFRGT